MWWCSEGVAGHITVYTVVKDSCVVRFEANGEDMVKRYIYIYTMPEVLVRSTRMMK